MAHFRYVVVDCSGRVDQTARLLCDHSNAVLLVAQADVVSLWSASRIRAFLEEGATRDRVRIVLNRYKKIPGFTDEDIEKATSCKLLWKIPNNYQSIAPAIDKGVPVAMQENTDIGRSFRSLAAALAQASPTAEGSLDLSYQNDKADPRRRPRGQAADFAAARGTVDSFQLVASGFQSLISRRFSSNNCHPERRLEPRRAVRASRGTPATGIAHWD